MCGRGRHLHWGFSWAQVGGSVLLRHSWQAFACPSSPARRLPQAREICGLSSQAGLSSPDAVFFAISSSNWPPFSQQHSHTCHQGEGRFLAMVASCGSVSRSHHSPLAPPALPVVTYGPDFMSVIPVHQAAQTAL